MASVADIIRSKVTWAKHHIEYFQLMASAYYDSDACVVLSKEDAKRFQRIYYIAKLDPIPDSIAKIVADAISNLRSPLDYLATQIEFTACGKEPKHQVSFPFGNDAKHYKRAREANIKCSGQAVIDAFDATEPYPGHKGHALWQLHMLNKPDKHRLPLTVLSGYRAFNATAVMRDALRGGPMNVDLLPTLWLKPEDRMCPLDVGREIFGEPLDLEVKENREFRLEISLNKPGVIECESALETLQGFAHLVDDTISAFAPLLPDQPVTL